jgi:radical SAM protein with 4Fe4S-binding SPASM domain
MPLINESADMTIHSIDVPHGVFSRIYRFDDGQTLVVAYRTPSQLMIQLEGDSAEVWQLLFDAKGKIEPALKYIIANGEFSGNPKLEAQEALNEFIAELHTSGLLGVAPPAKMCGDLTVGDAVDPQRNTTMQVAQIMADHHILYSLVLELTYRCNEKCVHCYMPDKRKGRELSLAEIETLLDQFVLLGGFQIQLTGGEALLRKDFPEILKAVTRRGLLPSITTNLTLLDDHLLEVIVAAAPYSVGCSVYSARSELHDAITNVKGSLSKTMAAAAKLREHGVPVVLKSPLMRDTAPYWREIETLARDTDCANQFDLHITAQNDGGSNPLAQRVTDPSVLNDIFSSNYYKLTVNDEPMAEMVAIDPDATICGAGAASLTLSPDGTIRPCIGLTNPLGRFPEQSLENIWNDSPFFAQWASLKLKDIEQCGKCPKLPWCSKCPGAWQAEHGDFKRPTPYTCQLAGAWRSAAISKS